MLNLDHEVSFVDIIDDQRDFSSNTFGPGQRTEGLIDHIQKECQEIRQAPHDLNEWVDVILLGIDGAWRAGHSPVDIERAVRRKIIKNRNRDWPDWRAMGQDVAIEHKKTGDSE